MEDGNEQQVQQFVRDSKRILESYLNEYGLVIYSHKSTLRRNPVLFYGYNPGYDPNTEHPIRWTIGQSLDYFADGFEVLASQAGDDPHKSPFLQRLHKDRNLIDDQCWPYANFKGDYRVGQAPYQQHTRNMLRAIGHPDALIANLLFGQAARPHKLPTSLPFEDACWKVHELVFRITKPNVIVTCAAVVDKALRRNFGLALVPPTRESGYGPPQRKWKCKHWEGKWRYGNTERRMVVCQIPHMSYYDITADYSKGVAEWVRGIVQESARD